HQQFRRMKVQTRREAVILMTAIPLLSTDAVAQPDRLDALFNRPAENLSVPSRVRQRYAILAYYIQLLNLQRPMRSSSEDIAAAIKTYQLVGESIARSDARFEGEVQASFVQSLRQAFSKSEEELWAFLRTRTSWGSFLLSGYHTAHIELRHLQRCHPDGHRERHQTVDPTSRLTLGR